MSLYQIFSILILALFAFISCQKHIKADKYSIADLLAKSLKQDTLEYSEWKTREGNFFFFKSGNFLSENTKNALYIHSDNDSVFILKLYKQEKQKWMEMTFVDSIHISPLYFDLKFRDFDFDGEKDIYIQTNVTNGSGISSGIVFIQKNNKLFLNEDLSYLGNITADTTGKTIISEKIIFCKSDGQKEICKTRHEWKGDNLVTKSIDCPCESE